jgi:hypothetical protein
MASRTLEIRLRFGHIRGWRLERDLTGNAINLGLAPPFLGCFHHRHRIANRLPGIIKLTEFRISSRQI